MTQGVKLLKRLEIEPGLSVQLDAFVALFAKWNEKINLSAARRLDEIDRHVEDSLHVIPHLRGAATVVDVGSGGGLPVVVAAICLPDTQFTALEPVHKKHAFLRTAARELRLTNLVAHARRVEDHDEHTYDVACSRATFDLGVWLTTGLTLVRPGGVVIGFEAVRRDDLPLVVERTAYEVDGKARSIVVARRSA